MEKHLYDDDDLERYLLGTMDEPERLAFEKQLSANPALADALQVHQDTTEGIQLDGSQALKEHLREVESELAGTGISRNPSDARTLRRPLMTWLAVAASLLAVVLLGYLVLPGPSPEKMYVAYYQPYPNLINPAQRSAEVKEETGLERAMRAYDGQQYVQALALFEQGDAFSNPGYTFYYAASYLGLNQPQKAIPLLERVAENQESLFYEPALWYLALAHLKMDDAAAAIPYLEKVATRDGDYAREAKEVLDELH